MLKRKSENKTDIAGGSARHSHKMIYETVKTIIICLLCVSGICIAYKIMKIQSGSDNTGNFWLVGSDPERVVSSELTTGNVLETFLDFSEPELIIVNKGKNRGKLRYDRGGYEETTDFINKVMQGIHSDSAEYSRVNTSAVLENLLKANSIYIKYPYSRLSELDAQFFQAEGSVFAENVSSYSDVFLFPDTSCERVVVFVMSEENPEEMVKIKSESFAATLLEIINSIEYINKKEYAFACELNLDKQGEVQNGGQLPSVLDSMIAIPLENNMTKSVRAIIPWEYENALNFTQTNDFSVGLMDIFNYNPNTIRQYADKEGTLNFVSEKGTLSMNREGILKYKALDETDGVAFVSGTGDRLNDLYTSTSGVIKTVRKILNLCYSGIEKDSIDIRFTNITKEENDIYFELEYFVNSYKVKMNEGCGVEAKTHSGVLTELKMHMKEFELSERENENITLIDAIDDFYAEGRENMRIEEANRVYRFSGEGNEMRTMWEIISGQER